MTSGTHREPVMPRRIRDAESHEVFWWSWKDRCYHDAATGHLSFPASKFLNYSGHLSAFYEEVAA